ncbi:translocation/assembly module TamB domain-containing protein, partial [bacterium]|nr:translocation/assembly module TamB domain-containing protein [bacterium]
MFQKFNLRSSLLGCAFFFLLAFLVLWASLSQVSLNSIVQTYLARFNQDYTGSIEIGDASLDWRSLRLENVTCKLDTGEVLATVPSAELQLHVMRSISKLDYMALLGDLSINEPELNCELGADGSLNWSKFKPKNPSPKKEPLAWDKYLCRYDGNIVVNNGQVLVHDYIHGDYCAQLDRLKLSVACTPGNRARLSLNFVPVQKINSFDPELGKVSISGLLAVEDRPNFSLELALQNIDLARLSDYPAFPDDVHVLSGHVNSKLWFNCKAQNWQDTLHKLAYGGDVKLQNISLSSINLPSSVENASAHINICSGIAKIVKANAEFAKIKTSLYGQINFDPNDLNKSNVDLKSDIKNINLEYLAKVFKIKAPVRGNIQVSLKANGALLDPRISGRLHSKSLEYEDHKAKNINAVFNYHNKLFSVDNFTLQAVGGKLKGNGYVLFEGEQPQVVFNLSGKQLSLAEISPIGGYIEGFKVAMVGTAKDPFIYGSGQGIGGFTGVASMLQDASGSFTLNKEMVSLSNGRALTTLGEANLAYANYNLCDKSVFAAVSTPGLVVPSVNVAQIGSVSGTIQGGAQVFGSADALNNLQVCAYSSGTNLRVGSLDITDLRGPVALTDMIVVLPHMDGYAAGGKVSASGWYSLDGGSSSFNLAADSVDITPFANLVHYDIPLDLTGCGNMAASWYCGGRGEDNWLRLYLGAQDYQVASQGFVGRDSLGLVAWASDLRLDGRRLTEDLHLAGSVTGQVGLWGSPKDLNLSYFSAVSNSPLEEIKDDALWVAGVGNIKGGKITLEDNILAWSYNGVSDKVYPHYVGGVYNIFGPNLAPPLRCIGLFDSNLPRSSLIKVDGTVNLGTPLSYQLAVSARDIDLAWLRTQSSLPQAGSLLNSAAISSGRANLVASISSKNGLPVIEKGTWFSVPWFMAGVGDNRHVFSASGLVSYDSGKLSIDRLLTANSCYIGVLPNGEEIAAFTYEDVPQGLVDANGYIDSGFVKLNASSSGWSTNQALAFVPKNSQKINDLLSGWMETDNLGVSFDMKRGILDTLTMDGHMRVYNGNFFLADSVLPIDDISANVHSDRNDGSLILSDLQLKSQGLVFKGSGKRDRQDHWNADIYADNVPLNYYNDFKGSARLAVHVESSDPSFNSLQILFAMEGKDVTLLSNNSNLAFPDFRIGKVKEDENGVLYAQEGDSLSVELHGKEAKVTLPEDVLKFSAYSYVPTDNLSENYRNSVLETYEKSKKEKSLPKNGELNFIEKDEKVFKHLFALDSQDNLLGVRFDRDPVSLDASGQFTFSTDFGDNIVDWFTGPGGPDFGNGEDKFVVNLNNFKSASVRTALGMKPGRRQFVLNGNLGLKGQWYKGHLAESPAGSLEYSFAIPKMVVGSVTAEDSQGSDKDNKKQKVTWNGLTLKNGGLRGVYKRSNTSGRLIIEPFELLPEKREFGQGVIQENEDKDSGSMVGSANIALMRIPRNMLSESEKAESSKEANELYLKMSKMPVSELASFIIPGISGGFVEDFVLNASGPILSPAFNLVFDISDGSLGSLQMASIKGIVSGSFDREAHRYKVRFGKMNTTLRNEQSRNIVNRGLDSILEGFTPEELGGIRAYIGGNKRNDRFFSISGTLPYNVKRTGNIDENRLVPFWRGVEASVDGDIDITASMRDKDFGLASSFVPDIENSSGDVSGSLHIGGTIKDPEIAGAFKVINGYLEHAKAGKISDFNIDADISELNDPEVKDLYWEKQKAKLIAAGESVEGIKPTFNRINIHKFSGLLGGKEFKLNGLADFDGFEPMKMDLKLKGEQLPLRWGSLFAGVANVDLNLQKKEEDDKSKPFNLNGVIDLPAGELTVDLDTAMSATSSDGGGFDWSKIPADYNVKLNMGDNVWAYALGSRLRLGGDLDIVADETGKPVLNGSIDLSRGLISIPLYDLSFKVRSGKINFENSQIPSLENIQADASVNGYEVTANVTGVYPNININFVSNPPLSEREIQRLLAIGSISNYSPSGNSLVPDNGTTTTGSRSVSS